MSKMSELSQVLDEMVACGEGLIRAANAIRDIFTDTAEPEPAEKPVTAAEPVKAAAEEVPQEEPPKKYTFAEIRKAFSAKSHAGYTEQVKALITSYGADKLSAVSEEDYPAIMRDLEDIA